MYVTLKILKLTNCCGAMVKGYGTNCYYLTTWNTYWHFIQTTLARNMWRFVPYSLKCLPSFHYLCRQEKLWKLKNGTSAVKKWKLALFEPTLTHTKKLFCIWHSTAFNAMSHSTPSAVHVNCNNINTIYWRGGGGAVLSQQFILKYCAQQNCSWSNGNERTC